MNSLITLILILLPMFIGFFLPINQIFSLYAEKMIQYLVLMILWVIGIELGLVEGLHQKLDDIILYIGCLFVLTLGFGGFGVWVFEKKYPCPYPKKTIKISNSTSFFGSFNQLICLALGIVVAKFFPSVFVLPKYSITVLLMALLFLVGIGLKNSKINLKDALFNPYGAYLSLVFIISTLLGGVVFALIFKLPIFQGLALASGFGWYSLSGTVMTDAYGAIWGSVALFNDLGREICALFFIPYVMRYSSSCAIGLGGVTSLDFTLPILTQSGGIALAPLIISFGVITNIVSPLLMVGFSALSGV